MEVDRGYRILVGEESKRFCRDLYDRSDIFGLLPSCQGKTTLWIYSTSILASQICDRVISNFSPTIYEFYRARLLRLPRSTWYQNEDDTYHLVLQFRYPLEIVWFMACAGLQMPFREIMQAIDSPL